MTPIVAEQYITLYCIVEIYIFPFFKRMLLKKIETLTVLRQLCHLYITLFGWILMCNTPEIFLSEK